DEEEEEKAPPVHRYNLRNQGAGLNTPASAGELADDEQENVKPPRVLDEKVNPIEDIDSDSAAAEAPATPAKGKKGKKGGSKAKASKK
ncbi:hypothetical protein GGI21_001280, partial [Coemansia aciculifera]